MILYRMLKGDNLIAFSYDKDVIMSKFKELDKERNEHNKLLSKYCERNNRISKSIYYGVYDDNTPVKRFITGRVTKREEENVKRIAEYLSKLYTDTNKIIRKIYRHSI